MRVVQINKQNIETTALVVKNFCEMVDAACLAGVSGFSIYYEIHQKNRSFWGWLLLYAGLAIALQAFLLFVKALNKRPNA